MKTLIFSPATDEHNQRHSFQQESRMSSHFISRCHTRTRTWLTVIGHSEQGRQCIKNLEIDVDNGYVDLIEVEERVTAHDTLHQFFGIDPDKQLIDGYRRALSGRSLLTEAAKSGEKVSLRQIIEPEPEHLKRAFTTETLKLVQNEAALQGMSRSLSYSLENITADIWKILCNICETLIFSPKTVLSRKDNEQFARVIAVRDLVFLLTPDFYKKISPLTAGQPIEDKLITAINDQSWLNY